MHILERLETAPYGAFAIDSRISPMARSIISCIICCITTPP